MSDPHVREIGRIEADSIGNMLAIGIDHGHVTIKCPPLSLSVGYLDQEQAEEFARLFIAACWAAERVWPEPEPEQAEPEVFTYKDGRTIPVVRRD